MLPTPMRVAVRGAPWATRVMPVRAAGAADVLDHQLLAERARHVLAEDAGDDVGRPAGRERHDHGDRLVGIVPIAPAAVSYMAGTTVAPSIAASSFLRITTLLLGSRSFSSLVKSQYCMAFE